MGRGEEGRGGEGVGKGAEHISCLYPRRSFKYRV